MKAIVKTKKAAGAEFKMVKEPEVGPNDVLIKTKAAAICGADIYIYYWTKQALGFNVPIPLIFGHEMSGEVVRIGKKVENLKKGDRVAVETHIPCGKCHLCQEGNMHICRNLTIFGIHTNGAFAEYVSTPSVCAYKIPENVSYEESAVFEPLGVGVHAVSISGIRMGDIIAVLGCGPIGLFTILAARESGATEIIATETIEYRRELAKKAGATTVLNPKNVNLMGELKKLTDGEGLDIVFETSGSPKALKQAFEMIGIHGKVIIVGVQPEPVAIDYYKHVIGKEAIIVGSYGRLMWDTWRRVSRLVAKRKIDVNSVITHKFPLDEMEEAFDLAKKKEAGKILFLF